MIKLLTGAPGAGKTAYLLTQLLKEINSGRPFYSHGIRDFTLPHFPILCRSNVCTVCREIEKDVTIPESEYMYAEDMPARIPSDALVIMDEAQFIYRPLPAGSKVPDYIQWLETHRHQGVDLWFVTQSPKFIHTNCRELITTHRHIVTGILSRKSYEWSECNYDTKDKRGSAHKQSYKLNKKVFDYYTSAVTHHAQKRDIPKLAYFLLPFAVLIIFSFIYLISSLTQTPESGELQIDRTLANEEESTNIFQNSLISRENPQNAAILDFRPVNPFVLETAPAYQSLVQVQDFPRIAACVATADRCQCYTQQATHYPTTYLQCLDFIDGKTFNPYLNE